MVWGQAWKILPSPQGHEPFWGRTRAGGSLNQTGWVWDSPEAALQGGWVKGFLGTFSYSPRGSPPPADEAFWAGGIPKGCCTTEGCFYRRRSGAKQLA